MHIFDILLMSIEEQEEYVVNRMKYWEERIIKGLPENIDEGEAGFLMMALVKTAVFITKRCGRDDEVMRQCMETYIEWFKGCEDEME